VKKKQVINFSTEEIEQENFSEFKVGSKVKTGRHLGEIIRIFSASSITDPVNQPLAMVKFRNDFLQGGHYYAWYYLSNLILL
jgi:hypothetical protein